MLFPVAHRFLDARRGKFHGLVARQRAALLGIREYVFRVGADLVFDGLQRLSLSAPWYSTEAQMTPPALAMKSGMTSLPFSCRMRSASGVNGMLAS